MIRRIIFPKGMHQKRKLKMISDSLMPKTPYDLSKALQRMSGAKIDILEPYHPSRERELKEMISEMSRGRGDLTIVVIRHK